MKAKELLSFVIDLDLSNKCHMVHTPKTTNTSDYERIWFEWFRDHLRTDDVCILDEDSDYLTVYVHEEDTWFIPYLDQLNVCYVNDKWRCHRFYLIKVE